MAEITTEDGYIFIGNRRLPDFTPPCNLPVISPQTQTKWKRIELDSPVPQLSTVPIEVLFTTII